MCGRFTLRAPLTVLATQFQFDRDSALDVRPRYNIAPTQNVLAVKQIEQGASRELAQFFRGLIPSWAKDNEGAYAYINARSDTIATKPTFRSAFKKRRCLVRADGYYEGRKEGKISGWRATAASAGGALVRRELLGSPTRGKSLLMLIAG